MKIRVKIKDIREYLGLSLREASKRIGVNRRTLKQLEDGDLGALKPYIRIAEFYGITLDAIANQEVITHDD